MRLQRINFVLLLCCTVMLGCARKTRVETKKPRQLSSTQPASSAISSDVDVNRRDLSGGTSSTPVKEGTLPLAYVVETAATVRVVDATSQTTIATADAAARSIVAVSTSGVTVGGNSLSSEPLNAKHKYVIFVDTDGVNESRSTRIRSSVKD
jgi:hypothetical protein